MSQKIRIFVYILCLLVAGKGIIWADSLQKEKNDKQKVKESSSVELLSKKKTGEEDKVTFRCRMAHFEDHCLMMARILKNDSAVHVVSPGVTFHLTDNDSITLKPERDMRCCSDWADGRWFNVAFRLDDTHIEKLKASGIVSISIPYQEGVISRTIVRGKEHAVANQLRSVE